MDRVYDYNIELKRYLKRFKKKTNLRNLKILIKIPD